MRTLWRIIKERHADGAFSGEGAARNGGRWNLRGTRVVYTSATQSLAALELLVHLNPPLPFRWVVFPVTCESALIEVYPAARLPAAWRSQPPPRVTQQIGTEWVRHSRSAVLAVPSVLVPDEHNYLLNPAHPDFGRIRVGPPRPFALDPRLIRFPESADPSQKPPPSS
ncbi:MAG: RES family NAD+ phosphorylase [Limisphaerales bacterium]